MNFRYNTTYHGQVIDNDPEPFNFSIAGSIDSDNDGLNDFYEVLNVTSPRLPDSDGDEWL